MCTSRSYEYLLGQDFSRNPDNNIFFRTTSVQKFWKSIGGWNAKILKPEMWS